MRLTKYKLGCDVCLGFSYDDIHRSTARKNSTSQRVRETREWCLSWPDLTVFGSVFYPLCVRPLKKRRQIKRKRKECTAVHIDLNGFVVSMPGVRQTLCVLSGELLWWKPWKAGRNIDPRIHIWQGYYPLQIRESSRGRWGDAPFGESPYALARLWYLWFDILNLILVFLTSSGVDERR